MLPPDKIQSDGEESMRESMSTSGLYIMQTWMTTPIPLPYSVGQKTQEWNPLCSHNLFLKCAFDNEGHLGAVLTLA